MVRECGHCLQSQTLEQLLYSDSSRGCLDEGDNSNVLLLSENLSGPLSLSIPNQRFTGRTMLYLGVDVDSSKLAVRRNQTRSRKEAGRKSEGSEQKGGLLCLPTTSYLSTSRNRREHPRTNYPLARKSPVLITRYSRSLFSRTTLIPGTHFTNACVCW